MNIHATGDNIKHLCKRKGLTLQILADRIGVSDCTMSNWINGHRQVTAYGLLRVSRVLGVTMEELMEGVEDEKYLPKEEPDITGDAISRQAAIDALRTCYDTETITMDNGDEYINYGDAVGEIEQLPPIQSESLQPWEVLVAQAVLPQPEIVRCKDCKHWIPYDWMFSEIWQSKNREDYPEDDIGCDCSDMAMKADDFCSRAERREVAT